MARNRKALTPRKRAIKNARARARYIERTRGIKIDLPQNLNTWTAANINKLTSRRMLREFSLVRVETPEGGEFEAPIELINTVIKQMQKVNKLREAVTGEPVYQTIPTVEKGRVKGLQTQSLGGLRRLAEGVKARTKKSFWSAADNTMVQNFMKTVSWIEDVDPVAWSLIQRELSRLGPSGVVEVLSRNLNSDRSLARYFFDSDQVYGISSIIEILDAFGILEEYNDMGGSDDANAAE